MLSYLQITPPLSFLRLDFLNDIFLFVDSIYSIDVHSWFYILSIVFLDISMPLLESMLLSSLLTPVEIGPSNASPGKQWMNERKEQIKNMTLARIWTQVIRHFAPTLYQLSYGVSCQNLNSKKKKLSHLQITPPLSFFRLECLNDICLFIDSIFSMDVHSWYYLFSIVFLDISMPLFESMLLSLLLSQSKLDLPTLCHGSRERKNATEQIKNMTLARISTQVLRHNGRRSTKWATVSVGRTWILIHIRFHISNPLRRYLSFVWTIWTTYFFLLTVLFLCMSTVDSIYLV